MKKYHWIQTLLLSLLLPLLLAPNLFLHNTHAADTETVEIVMHKRVYRDVRSPEDVWYVNDGLLISDPNHKLLSKTSGLNGANFHIFDLSAEYARVKKDWEPSAHDNQPFSDQLFIDLYRDKPRRQTLTWAKKELPLVATVKTKSDDALGEDGIARFNVTQGAVKNKKVYLILEDQLDPSMGLNIDMTQKTSPIVMILPMMHPSEESALNQIHIYPKNAAYVRDPYFFKFGKQVNGEEIRLAGAKFVLYQLINNQKRYLQLGAENDLGNRWVTSSDPLNDERVDKFTSDKDGLVNMGQRFLSAGTYYFEEVQTVNGYDLDASAKGIKVEVPAEWRDESGTFLPVMVNGQPLMELISGKVPEEAMQQAKPRVYNTQQGSKPPSTPGKPTPVNSVKPTSGASTAKGWLPQTGTVKTMATIVGFVLIFVAAIIYWRNRRQTEK
ncbi:MAG: pilin N-terminal domain-containing protein [Schleiferilactobacillus harbinensis]|jgi:LPXTG-motif cell wall-anchored protein|nr:pilin N-terminal domain-containing protein [Schleiferilactobacillus harbinensis]MCI1913825.1 pilin N-terminal domain-containing protein [Schleiferilactobacillus harbinensis]